MSNKRKQYIVDKKFQLKHTFSVIGIIFIIVVLIIGIIGIITALNNNNLSNMNKNNDTMVNTLHNINLIQDNIVQTIMTWAQSPYEKPQRQAINRIWKTHSNNQKTIENNINTLKTNITTINSIIKYNYILIISIIIIIILQSIILYFIMIRKTHKISGPIYVMTNYFREIIKGNYPKPRALRKGDELIEFYELFNKMVNTISKRDTK